MKNLVGVFLVLVLSINLLRAEVYEFSASDHGFTAAKLGADVSGAEFAYDEGRWFANGGEAGSDQFVQAVLASPVVGLEGEVFVRITHRYDFESEWDSAHLLVSIDGGPDLVAGEEVGIFLENGYEGTISEQSSNPRRGARAWTGKSSERVTSLIGLGELPEGTEIAVKLVATWDAGTVAPNPNWEVFEVAIVSGNEYRTWVVDNDSTNVSADFRGIDAAIEAAGPGDVILVMPSSTSYRDADIDKRLTIVGPGFGGAELGARYRDEVASFIDVRIQPGVRGVTVMGLSITGKVRFEGRTSDRRLSGVSNALFLRNRIGSVSVTSDGFVSDVFFINNWITGTIKLVERNNFTEFFAMRSAYFFNNVIRGSVDLYDSWTSTGATRVLFESVSQVVFANNLFDNVGASLDFRNGEFYNNVVHLGTDPDGNAGRFTPRNVQVDHNVFLGVLPSSVEADVNSFVKPAGEVLRWDDSPWFQRYELVEESPASTAGRTGGEVGIFGGLYPWDRDQAPPIPFVSNLEAPIIVGQGERMNFRVEVKSNQ